MDNALVEKVARAMVARRYPSLTNAEQDEMWDAWVGDAQAAIAAAADDLRLAGVKEGLEMAASYVDGQGGLIPGATAFVPLITGDNQPCMSGDARDRMRAHKRRQFDDATRSLSSAIRAIPVKADDRERA